MGGSKRYMEEQDALRSRVVQIGLDSEELNYCEPHEEAYHDTGATEETVERGVELFNNGDFEGFDSVEHVREFIEDTINQLPSECTRCEHNRGI
ncbi:hypothetical protein [Pseudomonas viridiflava]|uniref:hypothetical protein n=1 Tax=Pseudomonas viridiflava TaxID=33069 RepID=UPI002EBB4823|nr:hypothetical protein [Pseudomonas viridiflava]